MTVAAGAAVEAAAGVLGDLARRDVPLGPYTTYRVGGSAALFVEVDGEAALRSVSQAVARAAEAGGLPCLVVGKGSNLLVADGGFPGLALVLGPSFASIEIDDAAATVRAGGATSLPVLARRTAGAGLRGLEWAVGVPGSVGGGVRMNAGGHGSDMSATLLRARVLDLRSGVDDVRPAADLALGYRRSAIDPADVVVWAEFQLEPGDAGEAGAEVAEIVRWRRANQPGGQNAGSVFTNPPGDSAGRLIDLSGCKGLRRGSAEVSTKHANFIQADPDGSADDVADLIAEVQARVQAATGVLLHPELRMIGFDGLTLNGK